MDQTRRLGVKGSHGTAECMLMFFALEDVGEEYGADGACALPGAPSGQPLNAQ